MGPAGQLEAARLDWPRSSAWFKTYAKAMDKAEAAAVAAAESIGEQAVEGGDGEEAVDGSDGEEAVDVGDGEQAVDGVGDGEQAVEVDDCNAAIEAKVHAELASQSSRPFPKSPFGWGNKLNTSGA